MKTHKILVTTIATALFTFTTAPAIFAADGATTEVTKSEQAADGLFMDAVFRCNLAEIKAAEVAKETTKRDDVKDFANMMIRDHTDVNKNLKTITDKMKIELPKDPGPDNQVWLNKIITAPAAEFDRVYIDTMVEEHRKAVDMFEKFARTTKSAELKEFANNTLPGLRTHLQKSLEWQKVIASK